MKLPSRSRFSRSFAWISGWSPMTFSAVLSSRTVVSCPAEKTLVATLLIMGISTVGVGLVPGAVSIGIAAPILLLCLRLCQGFAVGGEWAGSALLSAEYAPAGRRGRYGMFTQLGAGAGLAVSNLVFFVVAVTIGERSEVFLDWGWRVPFLLSGLLVASH